MSDEQEEGSREALVLNTRCPPVNPQSRGTFVQITGDPSGVAAGSPSPRPVQTITVRRPLDRDTVAAGPPGSPPGQAIPDGMSTVTSGSPTLRPPPRRVIPARRSPDMSTVTAGPPGSPNLPLPSNSMSIPRGASMVAAGSPTLPPPPGHAIHARRPLDTSTVAASPPGTVRAALPTLRPLGYAIPVRRPLDMSTIAAGRNLHLPSVPIWRPHGMSTVAAGPPASRSRRPPPGRSDLVRMSLDRRTVAAGGELQRIMSNPQNQHVLRMQNQHFPQMQNQHFLHMQYQHILHDIPPRMPHQLGEMFLPQALGRQQHAEGTSTPTPVIIRNRNRQNQNILDHRPPLISQRMGTEAALGKTSSIIGCAQEVQRVRNRESNEYQAGLSRPNRKRQKVGRVTSNMPDAVLEGTLDMEEEQRRWLPDVPMKGSNPPSAKREDKLNIHAPDKFQGRERDCSDLAGHVDVQEQGEDELVNTSISEADPEQIHAEDGLNHGSTSGNPNPREHSRLSFGRGWDLATRGQPGSPRPRRGRS